MASLYEEELAAASDGGGFQVYPKKSTPHLDCISTDALDGAKAEAFDPRLLLERLHEARRISR